MKKKIFSFLLMFCLMLPCAFLLSACGNKPKKEETSVSVSISQSSQYYNFYDGQYLNLQQEERNFTKDDFIVTIYYSDTSQENTTDYSFTVDEGLTSLDENTNFYNINFFRKDQRFATITCKVVKPDEELPTLTGLRKDGDVYYLNQELRYNGEEQSAIDYISTSESGITLRTLITEGKVTYNVDGGTVSATTANVFYDDEYSYNTFILSANDGYTWKDNGTEIKDITIKWQIKRQILETPTVTSDVEFEYAYQINSGNLEGVERGLTFDYKGNEELINDNGTKLSYAGEHSWRLELYDSDNYAFLDGEQETNYLDYAWKITPKKLNVNDVLIDDATHLVETEYHYTYTGEEIKPTLNIDADCPVFYINYANSGEASDNAYNVEVSVNSNLFFIPDGESSVLNNFVWANGDKIDINYRKSLEFYIDKAQVVAPNGFKESSIEFNSQEYDPYGNTLYNFYLTNDSSYSSFTTETLSALNDLGMFDYTAGFEWADENQSLNVGANEAVLYWFSSKVGNYKDNYIPLEITVNVEITKAKAKVEAIWSQNSDTNKWTIQSLENEYVNNVIENITYKTYYSETEYSTSKEAENLTDAGYYTTIATLPENANYEYYLDENGEAITTLSKQWSIDKTNIDLGYNVYNAWSLSDGTNTSSQLDSYYYKNDGVAVSKNVTFDSSTLSSDAQSMFDVSVSHYVLESEGWVEVTNCTDVGVYKSVATFTFKEGYKAKNYVVNGGYYNTDAGIQISKDWSIYPNTYTLTTTDATSENYVGWPTDVQTAFVYNGEYQQPEAIVPDGLVISYHWSNADNIYSSDNRGRSDIGTYIIHAYLKVQTGLLGFDKVKVVVDETTYLENGQRISYSSLTGEEEGRYDVSGNYGTFYFGIESKDYVIYEENFFAGKTFVLSNVVAQATDGTTLAEDNEYVVMAQNLSTENTGKTIIFASDLSVKGTCDSGAGAFNDLTGDDAYSYLEYEGKTSITNKTSELVGSMLNETTLRLISNVSSGVILLFTFTLQ